MYTQTPTPLSLPSLTWPVYSPSMFVPGTSDVAKVATGEEEGGGHYEQGGALC